MTLDLSLPLVPAQLTVSDGAVGTKKQGWLKTAHIQGSTRIEVQLLPWRKGAQM